MKISKRDRKVLVFGGVGVAVILIAVYVALPLYQTMSEAPGQLDQKRRVLDQHVRAIGSEAAYRQESEYLDQELQRLHSQLLDSSDPADAQVQLESLVRSLAEQNGVGITRSTPLQERKQGEEYAKVTVQLTLQGAMGELAAFMHALATHPKYLMVDDFFVNGFQVGKDIRLQPRMSVSGFIRLTKKAG
jgi:Tfp pilus assembly protein PilO